MSRRCAALLGSRSRSRISPDDGGRTVPIMRRSEVLPAPFGPSRPKTPGPASRLTPSTALFLPNDRVTFVSSIFIGPSLRAGGVADGDRGAERDGQVRQVGGAIGDGGGEVAAR